MTDNSAYIATKIAQLDAEIEKHELLIETLHERRRSYEEQLPVDDDFAAEANAAARESAAFFSGTPATPPAASSTELDE